MVDGRYRVLTFNSDGSINGIVTVCLDKVKRPVTPGTKQWRRCEKAARRNRSE